MKTLLIALLLLVPAAAVNAQQSAPDPARRAAMEARRDSLEAQLLSRFMEQLTRELRLDADQRVRTERVLQAGAESRRDLMRASGSLRAQLSRALRNNATPDAEFTRLLAEQESLRQRENELWRREQDELARVLNPRQRVEFVIQHARFQESVRDIIAQHMRGRSH